MRLTTIAAVGLLTTAGFSQDIANLTIGGPDTFGCQEPYSNPPTLTGSVAASADLVFAYDRLTGILTLTATNTSAVVSGEYTPVINRILFNLPRDAVTGASLIDQSAASGTPAFALTYAQDGLRGACLGYFDIELATAGSAGGIANASATMSGGQGGSTAVGPATFRIQLEGPGITTINANSIAYGYSTGGSQDAHAVVKFQGGGIDAEESGWIGNGNECNCGMWTSAEARIGTRFEFCVAGDPDCHICLWISTTAGPTHFPAPFEHLVANVGFPLDDLTLGSFPSNHEVCFDVLIPNDPNLVGSTLYMTVLTGDVTLPLDPQSLRFCGDYSLTFVQ